MRCCGKRTWQEMCRSTALVPNLSSQILSLVYFHPVFVFFRKVFYVVFFKKMSQASSLKPWSPPFSTQERRCSHLFPARHLQRFLHVHVNTSWGCKCILCCYHQVFLDFPLWWLFWSPSSLNLLVREKCDKNQHRFKTVNTGSAGDPS